MNIKICQRPFQLWMHHARFRVDTLIENVHVRRSQRGCERYLLSEKPTGKEKAIPASFAFQSRYICVRCTRDNSSMPTGKATERCCCSCERSLFKAFSEFQPTKNEQKAFSPSKRFESSTVGGWQPTSSTLEQSTPNSFTANSIPFLENEDESGKRLQKQHSLSKSSQTVLQQLFEKA